MKINFISLLFVSVLFLTTGCKKDGSLSQRICNSSSDGNFSATLNSQSWTACNFKAVYYPKAKVLAINAIDQSSDFELRFFITVDSVNPLKTYAINTYEKNGLEIVQRITISSGYSEDIYFCDLISPSTGGSISISKLDTIAGVISATFNVNGYSKNQNKSISLNNGILSDVKLTTSVYTYYNDSYISATVNGTNWYSSISFAGITEYIGSPTYSFLEVRAMGYPYDLGESPQYLQSFSRSPFWANGRNLVFNIPLSQSASIYPLEPTNQFHQTLFSMHYLLNYNLHDDSNLFYPIAGSTISFSSIDTANRNLEGTFTTQLRDSSGHTINFANGKIHVKNWAKL